jgi:hypothetical protein
MIHPPDSFSSRKFFVDNNLFSGKNDYFRTLKQAFSYIFYRWEMKSFFLGLINFWPNELAVNLWDSFYCVLDFGISVLCLK